MKRILAIALIFLFPLSGYCLSDQDVFNLLSKTSKKIELPLHVYIVPLHKDKKWSYGAYDGSRCLFHHIGILEIHMDN